MYARVARFEGGDPAAVDREIEQMREQINSGMSDESIEEAASQPGAPSAEQQKWMRDAIKKMVVLVDRDKGSSAMVVFTDTEEDIRRIDEMFNQMSPGDEGGKRQTADVYEVAIDQDFRS
jgi:siroheme synthase